MKRGIAFWLVVSSLLGCSDGAVTASAARTFATPFSSSTANDGDNALAPLPQSVDLDKRKVILGERLFRDQRMSGDGKVACSDCHALDRGGANGLYRSDLPGREPVTVNVPSIFNAAFAFRFGWSGRFEDIGQQLDAAMELKTAMRSTWHAAATILSRDVSYVDAFAEIYPEGLTPQSVREALAVYSLSLITPNARFDRYLRGEIALSPSEQRGYDLFREYGCVSCHQGIGIGGNMLQRFGVMRNYFDDRGSVQPADRGLYAATGRDEDMHVFRVPSLRNVALTAPYFHDGSAETLEDAAQEMALYQLGRELSSEQASGIAAFLRSLTGELEGKPL